MQGAAVAINARHVTDWLQYLNALHSSYSLSIVTKLLKVMGASCHVKTASRVCNGLLKLAKYRHVQTCHNLHVLESSYAGPYHTSKPCTYHGLQKNSITCLSPAHPYPPRNICHDVVDALKCPVYDRLHSSHL